MKGFEFFLCILFRGGSRTAATSKMEHFVIIVNGWKPLTVITKRSILDVEAVLHPFLLFNASFFAPFQSKCHYDRFV